MQKCSFNVKKLKKVLKRCFLSLLKLPRKSLKNQDSGNLRWQINTAANSTSVTAPGFAAGGGVRASGQDGSRKKT